LTCPSTEELAALYDGNLPKKHAERLQGHLALCARCAADLKILHQSLQQMKSAPKLPRELLVQAQQERVARKSPQKKQLAKRQPSPAASPRRRSKTLT
jgi:anti-sigma factor RsiW